MEGPMPHLTVPTHLRDRFSGALLAPDHPAYDTARRVWNGAVDRRPALIARATSAADVRTVVRHVREHDLPLSVRGGGHSVLGHGVRDGGVLLDLSLMTTVAVDPLARVAWAEGGATWAAMDAATQRFGLATTGGSVGSTGIAGLSLAGGFGHLLRRHGLTVDNLRAVDLVTADGHLVRVDGCHDPELLWGLRGGGGNFGVAVRLAYDLHPVGPLVLAGPVFWPLDQAAEVLRFLDDFAPTAPDDLGVGIVLGSLPPLPFLPAHAYGTPGLGLLISWSGDPAEGERVVEPLLGVGSPVGGLVRPIPYRALQSLLDGAASGGNHAYWRSHRLARFDDDVLDAVLDAAARRTSPLSLLNGWVIGGAASRVDPAATAVGPRTAGYELRFIALWPPGDPAPDRHRDWVRDAWGRLLPSSTGQFATFLSDEGPDGVRRAFGPGLPRLVALKDRWDPTNLFDSNVNITPSGGAS
jgi:FAD binding domain-containing protein/berberine-like enzyme